MVVGYHTDFRASTDNLSIMKWMEDMPEKTTDFEPIPIDNQDGSFENQGKEGPPDDQCHVLQLLSNVEDLQISEDEPLQNEAPPAASTCSPEVLPHFEPNYFYLVRMTPFKMK